jgi:hypothetical protein
MGARPAHEKLGHFELIFVVRCSSGHLEGSNFLQSQSKVEGAKCLRTRISVFALRSLAVAVY